MRESKSEISWPNPPSRREDTEISIVGDTGQGRNPLPRRNLHLADMGPESRGFIGSRRNLNLNPFVYFLPMLLTDVGAKDRSSF